MSAASSLKDIWKANGYVLNGYVSISSAFCAEIYALQGWDAVTIDMEHGSIGFDGAVAILQAMTASGVVPLIRIPKGDPAIIGMLLDAGALGITGAMINTKADAENLVSACKYPPAGTRSLSRQTRAAFVYGPDYADSANQKISVFAMIESVEGMENLEAITGVPGIDGIYFGAVDYALSCRSAAAPGPTSGFDIEAMVAKAEQRIISVCNSRNILAGINARDSDVAARMLDAGFRFITLSSDAKAMITQSKAWVDGARMEAERRLRR